MQHHLINQSVKTSIFALTTTYIKVLVIIYILCSLTFFQAILIMETAIQKYGSYETFEEQTGGKIIQRSAIMTLIQRYLKRDDLEQEIVINLSEDLLSRGSMTRVKGKPQLNVRVVNLREFWVEGLLRHEIGIVNLLINYYL